MKRISFFIILMTMCISLVGCSNTLKTSTSSDDYIGMNYQLVINELKKAGFKDITTVVIEDLSSTSTMSEGTVEQVSINGSTSFVAKSTFPTDTVVVITYHAIKKVYTPISSDDLHTNDYESLASMFKDAGFANVELKEVFDLDPDTTNADYINEISINGRSTFNSDEEFPYDAVTTVICHRPYEKFVVKVHVDFIANLIFNKYDVALLINNEQQQTLVHGKDVDFEFKLKEGQYVIAFTEIGSSSVKGTTTIDVSSNMDISYKISCYSDKITVETIYIDREEILSNNEVKVLSSASDYNYKDYRDVITSLEAAGFTNIKVEPVYDIYFGILVSEGELKAVTIDGKSSFRKGDIFQNDAEVKIIYHSSIENDPSIQAAKQATEAQKLLEEQLEAIFSKELAKRAAVVAFTNYYALDVFTPDGNNFDASKFHSYTDTTGDASKYFWYVKSEGTWSAKNENTWHVEDLYLQSYAFSNSIVFVSLDVNFDGKDYTVSNLAGKAPSYDDANDVYSDMSVMENSSDAALFFIVPFELIEDDRIASEVDALDHSKELRVEQAHKAFENVGNALYPYGFECHWYSGLIDSWQSYDGSWFFKVEVTITNQYGASRKMTAEAYINNVTKSVENFLVY